MLIKKVAKPKAQMDLGITGGFKGELLEILLGMIV